MNTEDLENNKNIKHSVLFMLFYFLSVLVLGGCLTYYFFLKKEVTPLLQQNTVAVNQQISVPLIPRIVSPAENELLYAGLPITVKWEPFAIEEGDHVEAWVGVVGGTSVLVSTPEINTESGSYTLNLRDDDWNTILSSDIASGRKCNTMSIKMNIGNNVQTGPGVLQTNVKNILQTAVTVANSTSTKKINDCYEEFVP